MIPGVPESDGPLRSGRFADGMRSCLFAREEGGHPNGALNFEGFAPSMDEAPCREMGTVPPLRRERAQSVS